MPATVVGTCVNARKNLPVLFMDELGLILDEEDFELRLDAFVLTKKDFDLIIERVVPETPSSQLVVRIYEAAQRYGIDLTRIEVIFEQIHN